MERKMYFFSNICYLWMQVHSTSIKVKKYLVPVTFFSYPEQQKARKYRYRSFFIFVKSRW